MSCSSFFGLFDPKTGDVPDFPFSHLPDIASRARQILSWRSLDQIIHVAEIIDWMVADYFDSCRNDVIQAIAAHGDWQLGDRTYTVRSLADAESLLDDWPVEAEDMKPPFRDRYNTVATTALKACIGGFDVSKDAACPDASEADYFAVLALWKLQDAVRWCDRSPGQLVYSTEAAAFLAKLPDHYSATFPRTILSAAGKYAIEAMDAVCWAEGMGIVNAFRFSTDGLKRELTEAEKSTEARAEEIVKRRKSVDASTAAIARHVENHQIKATVFEWCEKHRNEYGSNAAAAEVIAGRGKLVPMTFKTVEKWIGEWKRSQDRLRAGHP